MLAVRPDASLFFGNVDHLRLTAVRNLVADTAPPLRAVVLDLTSSYRLPWTTPFPPRPADRPNWAPRRLGVLEPVSRVG
ncbi:hypothetical protein LUR56_39400 [Streptomyces sp. MT29]|nr:hypothetical protein [Streptomyces sp. MT29]